MAPLLMIRIDFGYRAWGFGALFAVAGLGLRRRDFREQDSGAVMSRKSRQPDCSAMKE